MEYDEILKRMLDRVPDDIDKREGSVIYNALAPSAIEMATLYFTLQNIIDLLFPDTSVDVFLDKICDQIGITRKDATYAVRKGLFYNTDNELMDIDIGTRYSANSVAFTATEKISTGIYKMTCETSGTEGNNYVGNLVPIQYIQDLAIVQLTDILIPGEDIETDDELRQRYFETINEKVFAGNIADYKTNTKAIDGIGAVKVIPVWNGGGTVKLTILDSNFDKASNELISVVQEEIDPTQDGSGIGLAPIGHVVTVVTTDNTTINLNTNVTLTDNITLATIKDKIEEVLDDYLLELRKSWEDEESLIVRISQIESRILNLDGVLDIVNTTINGNASNLEILSTNIPVIGEVIVNAIN